MGFSREEYWSGLPFPPLVDLPDTGIEPESLVPPELGGRFFTTSATWETSFDHGFFQKNFRGIKKKSLTLLNPSIDIQRAYTVPIFILLMRKR